MRSSAAIPRLLMLRLVPVMAACFSGLSAGDADNTAERALSIVSRHKGVFTAPPVLMPTRKVPDGPLLGNGDVGVAIGGVLERQRQYDHGADNTASTIIPTSSPERHRFWIAKNDFWKTKAIYPNAHPCPIGGIDVTIPALVNGEYHAEQILESAEVLHTLKTTQRTSDPPPYTRAGATIHFRSWVAAIQNLLVIELSVDGDPAATSPYKTTDLVGVDVTLWPQTGNEAETATGNLPDGYWALRRFASTTESIAVEQSPCKQTSEAAVAMRLLNHRQPGLPAFRLDGWPADRFVLTPSHPVIIVAAIVTSEESATPLATARQRVADVTLESIETLRTAHHQWWRDFWAKSFVDIGDPLIEKYYYGSNYLLASCSRNQRFPPALFGNWTTADGPSWQGDYHLNYNYQAPWWGVYSSNHCELADPYDTPILDYLPVAKDNARKLLGVRGVYYDVGVGPGGLESSLVAKGYSIPGEGDRMFHGQKSNAVFLSANMFMRFYHTYDLDYARRVYPFLCEVANFWEDYLKFENGRYVIAGDALGETGNGIGDVNNCLSLGLLKMFFKGMLDVSTELGTDAARREKWQHILTHLSDFPTTVTADGVRRVRGAEDGPAAKRVGPRRGSTRVEFTGMVWPSCVLGMGSPPALLKVLQDDVREWPESEWINHYNGFSQSFPGAARVGHDPRDILAKLRQQLSVAGFPNFMVFGGGGGIENCSGVPATINEMLVQSHAGVMRVFPVWPKNQAASFGRLRTDGAFLVSSELRDGEVQALTIESEKGRECVVQNPWPGHSLQLTRNGKPAEVLSDDCLRFNTAVGECITLQHIAAATPTR
ncbi:MAG: glycoside hydrolase family 95-like protein [Verrucomicrobiota bacterium]